MIILTDHSISQYISRFNRETSFNQAKKYLEKQLPFAKKLDRLTRNGQELWEIPCGAKLISKRDSNNYVVVTILKQDDNEITQEELDLITQKSQLPQRYDEYSYRISLDINFGYKIHSSKNDRQNIVNERLKKVVVNVTKSILKFNNIDVAEITEGSITVNGVKEHEKQIKGETK